MGSECGHDHHLSGGLAEPELARALERTQAVLAERGERLTTSRRRVLELLLEAGRPIKAYDLIADFGGDGRAAKPPTVYRALDFLERTGLVHRIASISAYVACSHGDADHAAAFLICDCCGETRELAPPQMGSLLNSAAHEGYRIGRIALEAHGLCRDCQAPAANA
ncbi:MAG: transcriptional repressor [Caulobacterales bacterium]|nr:transcriptional repressor [Caulobacterales bacterium]